MRWCSRSILLILLCLGIHTHSDHLHSNETSRARQCPQVFIWHPLLSSWVEFNYPTNLGVAVPDVGYWPRHFRWKDLSLPERAGKADLRGGTLKGEKKKRGMKLGRRGGMAWNLWGFPQSQMVNLKPQEPLGICEGHWGRPPTSVRHKEPHVYNQLTQLLSVHNNKIILLTWMTDTHSCSILILAWFMGAAWSIN